MPPSRTGIARREVSDAPDGSVELYYEELGDPAGPAVLLIMGLGAQLPMWPDGFCARLVDRGYRVIRFDHRDTGLSAKMHGLPPHPVSRRGTPGRSTRSPRISATSM